MPDLRFLTPRASPVGRIKPVSIQGRVAVEIHMDERLVLAIGQRYAGGNRAGKPYLTIEEVRALLELQSI